MDASAGSIIGGVGASTGALFPHSDALTDPIGCDQPARSQVLCSRCSQCVGANAAIPP